MERKMGKGVKFYLALCICVLSQQVVNGQLWAFPEADWTVGISSGQSATNGFRHFQYMGDTMVYGQNAQHISLFQEIAVYSFNNFNYIDSVFADFYTTVQNDVVFLYVDSLAQWDTLYWYGSIGDRWYPPGYSTPCPPRGMLQIIDTSSTTDFGGISLRTRELAYLDSTNNIDQFSWQLVERIGVPQWVTDPQTLLPACIDLTDIWATQSLRCYSDSTINHTPGNSPYGCDWFYSVDEHEALIDIDLFPNPSNGSISIKMDTEISSIQVLDAAGRLLRSLNGPYFKGTHEVDLSDLQNGVYQIRVLGQRGIQTAKTFVKQ